MTKKKDTGFSKRISQLPSVENVDKMHSDIKTNSRVKIERKKFGTQLRPELITKLKMQALQENTNLTNLLEKILNQYLSK